MTEKKDMENLEKKLNNTCDIESEKENFEKTKRPNTDTDVYYQTECKLEDSKVGIPTYDSVVEAKKWIDDENKR